MEEGEDHNLFNTIKPWPVCFLKVRNIIFFNMLKKHLKRHLWVRWTLGRLMGFHLNCRPLMRSDLDLSHQRSHRDAISDLIRTFCFILWRNMAPQLTAMLRYQQLIFWAQGTQMCPQQCGDFFLPKKGSLVPCGRFRIPPGWKSSSYWPQKSRFGTPVESSLFVEHRQSWGQGKSRRIRELRVV